LTTEFFTAIYDVINSQLLTGNDGLSDLTLRQILCLIALKKEKVMNNKFEMIFKVNEDDINMVEIWTKNNELMAVAHIDVFAGDLLDKLREDEEVHCRLEII
jgi:hypothetical protein